MMGILSSLVSVAAPVVGGLFGGPVGAAIGAGIGSAVSGYQASKDTQKATDKNLAFQQKGLDYAMSINKQPLEYRDKALEQYGAFLGLNDTPSTLVEDVRSSPFYSSMVDEGQQGLAAGLSATGGLRTGNANEAFSGLNQRVLQSLVNQRLGALKQLSSTPIITSGVQAGYSNMGSAAQQGALGSAQALQTGAGEAFKSLLPLLTAPSAPSTAGSYSAPLSQYQNWVTV